MNINEFNKLFPSVKNLYFSEIFDDRNVPFCSFMKEIKEDDEKFNKLAAVLAEKIKNSAKKIDILISVPKFTDESDESDYSKTLAKILSNKLNIPYENHILTKIKKTKKLKTIPHKERIKEIDSAFKVNLAMNLKICIVDDVLSSGATLHEAVKVLLNAGIKDISIAVMVFQDIKA